MKTLSSDIRLGIGMSESISFLDCQGRWFEWGSLMLLSILNFNDPSLMYYHFFKSNLTYRGVVTIDVGEVLCSTL